MIEKIRFLLESWGRLIRTIESILIDNIAATTPWAAPIVPAYMVWMSLSGRLGFPAWVALASAGVVEFLGLSSVYTAFQFWEFNDARGGQQAPVWIAIGTSAFYLAVVLTVNIILDQAGNEEKIAKALLSTLSICAAIILAIRSQHARRLNKIEAERRERKEVYKERQLRKLSESSGKLPDTAQYAVLGKSKLDWRQIPIEDKQQIALMSTAQIMQAYQVSDRTARNWSTWAKSNGHTHLE